MEGHNPHSLEYFPVYISSKGAFIHYTCNSPDKGILEKNGVQTKGEDFGCANETEVLEIPEKLYFKKGFEELKDQRSLKVNLERVLRDLG